MFNVCVWVSSQAYSYCMAPISATLISLERESEWKTQSQHTGMRRACAASRSGHTSANPAIVCVHGEESERKTGCFSVHMCECTTQVCIRARTRDSKQEPSVKTWAVWMTKLNFLTKSMHCNIPHSGVHAWACSHLSKILQPKLSNKACLFT